MPLLATEAAKLSNNQLVAGVVEEIIDRDHMFALVPFTGVNGKAYVYNRENTIPEGDFLDPNDTVNEAAATFTQVTTTLKILVGDVDVDKFLASTQSDTQSQIATQIQAKAKGLGRKFRRTLAQGDSSVDTKSFDGLPKLVADDRKFAAGVNGGALTFSMLDQLADLVPNRPDAFVMRPGTIRAYKALCRALYGANPEMVQLPNFTGSPIIAHDGIPIIMNEFLSDAETEGTNDATCSVYAVRFNEADGLHGIYGGESAGLQVENLGTVQNKDAWRYRMKWYVSLALKSTRSLAAITGITNI